MPIDPGTAPVRVALVGLGNHGRTIQEAAGRAANLAVVAVCDPDAREAAAAAERFACAAAAYEDLLRRDDVEAVVLVTPNHLHRAQAEAAFAAGLHVFVEKPIANTVADGRAMLAAAEGAGRVLMVGHNMRYGPAARDVRALVREGRLGTVVSVEVHFSSDTLRRLPAGAWRLRPEACPLLPVMQLGIHGVDLVHALLGPIRAVHALTHGVLAPPGVVDSTVAAFRVAGGPLGTLVSHYCTPVRFSYRLAGTEGSVAATPDRYTFTPRVPGEGEPREGDYTADPFASYTAQMHAFGEAVRTGAAPEADGWAGLQALAVVEALQRSADHAAPEMVADVLDARAG